MKKKRRHDEKLSEDDAMQLVLKSHPEWRRQWERGTLPDEMLGEDGEPMSPLRVSAVKWSVKDNAG